MKFIQERLIQFQGKIRSIQLTAGLEQFGELILVFYERIIIAAFLQLFRPFIFAGVTIKKNVSQIFSRKQIINTNQINVVGAPAIAISQKNKRRSLKEWFAIALPQAEQMFNKVKTIGFDETMDDYEKRKLGIFNQLNFFQLVTGIIVPIFCIFNSNTLSPLLQLLSCCPAFISLTVLVMNYYKQYDAAMISYFILYPFFNCLLYMGGMNLGTELYFILYGVLSVFFLAHISHMLFCVALSMLSYFMLAVVLNKYQYRLEDTYLAFYLFNQIIAIVLIFYGLYLIKKENTGYQFSILNNNRVLHRVNLEIEKQKEEIAQKAAQLEELNALKNKLFSIISHDLKTPIYALRNLFGTLHKHDVPAAEIKPLIPDVVEDLNYVTGLMENLLSWAKTQMQASELKLQSVDIGALINDVTNLLRLQAQAKSIRIENKIANSLYIHADKDMIHMVLRNLLSNAIKFTPERGEICVGAQEVSSTVEVFVRDSGTGITPEALEKIKQNDYYTTKGTANESGTGLGLMLCKEFLAKNGGQMNVESEPGKGSTFSFTLPKSNEEEEL